MSFPLSYRAIRDLVAGELLKTGVARDIARKAGLRAGSESITTGRPPFTVIRFETYGSTTFAPGTPSTDQQTQFSRALNRRYATFSHPLNTTNPVAGNNSQPRTILWLEPFSEVRVTARVITSTPNMYLIPAFGPLSGAWSTVLGTAQFADTAELVRTGAGMMLSLTAPFAKSEWMPIHPSFKSAGEVRAGLFVRNLATSPNTPEWGVLEMQLR